jgi:tetratricopeptide (TPR) repeat protein
MKKLMFGLLSLLFFVNLGGAKNPKDYTFYDDLDPAARKEFADAWLSAGKAFHDAGKAKKAKASFLFTYYLYPMGDSSVEACDLIKKNFKETYTYNADKFFSYYMTHGKSLMDAKKKLNNFLMALEVKPGDPNANFAAAKAYYEMGDTEKAKSYLKTAIENGLDPETLPSEFQALTQ